MPEEMDLKHKNVKHVEYCGKPQPLSGSDYLFIFKVYKSSRKDHMAGNWMPMHEPE